MKDERNFDVTVEDPSEGFSDMRFNFNDLRMVLEKDAVDMFKDIPSPEQVAELEAKLPLRFEYKYQRKEEVSYICKIPESS